MAYYILKSLSSLSTVLEVSLRLIAMSSIQGWPPTASQMVTYIGNLNKKKSSDFDCIPTNLLMQLPLNLFFFPIFYYQHYAQPPHVSWLLEESVNCISSITGSEYLCPFQLPTYHSSILSVENLLIYIDKSSEAVGNRQFENYSGVVSVPI